MTTHLALGEKSGRPDLARVRELCAEGETLYADVGDPEGRAFFQEIRRALSQGVGG